MNEKMKIFWFSGITAMMFILSPVVYGQETAVADYEKMWSDMMHYTLIGKWDIAKGHGEDLLSSQPDPVKILNLAESPRWSSAYRNLSLMQDNTPLKPLAEKIVALVEHGRFLQRTSAERIITEVKRLSGTTKGRMIAISRLKDSGEWAVPIMVEAWRDPDRNKEISNINWAMPQLGRPAVNPLLTALQHCTDLNVRKLILNSLAKLGYSDALPYIQQLVESPNSSAELIAAAKAAIQGIAGQNLPDQITAATLFEKLSNDFYDHLPSLAVPAGQDLANIWFWDDNKGLVKEEVPRGAFDELMTMRCCEDTVRLDPSRAGAIALWISSFVRLESEGYDQPLFFGENHADAGTYALTAGPEYLHRVLLRAMENRNRPVALAAITALNRNAGQQSLLYKVRGRKPMIEALSFPDREVRFSAAMAIGQILPRKEVENQDLVIDILAEALRQKGKRFAMIIDKNQNDRNTLAGQLRDSNVYASVIADEYFSSAVKEARRMPSMDLIVLEYGIENPSVKETLEIVKGDYRLAFCPTVLLTPHVSLPSAQELAAEYPFVDVVVKGSTVEDILKIEQEILAVNNARVFKGDLSDTYATRAAELLRQLALTNNKILPIGNAEPALINAIREERSEIQKSAILALARMDSVDAQRALAQMALDVEVDPQIRMMLFTNLSISAKQFGNLLLAEHISEMYDKIVSSVTVDADLRKVASEAYGSLNLPSAKISQLILDQSKN